MSYGKKVLEQISEDLELMGIGEYEELYDRAIQHEEVTLIIEPVFTSCITYSKSIFRKFNHDDRRMYEELSVQEVGSFTNPWESNLEIPGGGLNYIEHDSYLLAA